VAQVFRLIELDFFGFLLTSISRLSPILFEPVSWLSVRQLDLMAVAQNDAFVRHDLNH
jgi:hypothetical protein